MCQHTAWIGKRTTLCTARRSTHTTREPPQVAPQEAPRRRSRPTCAHSSSGAMSPVLSAYPPISAVSSASPRRLGVCPRGETSARWPYSDPWAALCATWRLHSRSWLIRARQGRRRHRMPWRPSPPWKRRMCAQSASPSGVKRRQAPMHRTQTYSAPLILRYTHSKRLERTWTSTPAPPVSISARRTICTRACSRMRRGMARQRHGTGL
mmetsp:Transcript_11203/g.29192  ORF Transcript_11203/g.29192 Transcript_11203/m.29192 type:complete len:209 (+) Transcript_11203:403-1029(+)